MNICLRSISALVEWFSNFSIRITWMTLKHGLLGPNHSFWFSRYGVGPKILYFSKVSGDADASGLSNTLWEPLLSNGTPGIGSEMRSFSVAGYHTNVSSVDQVNLGLLVSTQACQNLAGPGFTQLEQWCIEILLSQLVSSTNHPFV